MKKLFIIMLLALWAAQGWAQPILVGHRGSGYGLENSEESFKRGIELGYKYLETDVKFTKDNVLVCSHDDDTKRLGGTKTLASSTLEELQSETLTQTRSGVKYTGRLCSMKEYLQICKDGGVGPLIELKWTAGINSNDCSKIPLLIEQIEEMGMRDKCIILTSMKPCLEYIRTNYPDIELQFLTGQYWSNHFDWCVKWNIDVDIQATYFDKSTVEKYHDKGLKVNMWTTNDAAGYRSYGNMGCDFITTDRLDASDLPELDPEILFPPNTVDYPRTQFNPSIKSSYELDGLTRAAYPQALKALKVKKAVKAPDGWFVIGAAAAGSNMVYFIADSDASNATKVNVEGTEALADIALTADGKLIGCTSATFPGGVYSLYIWDKASAKPALLASCSEFPAADITLGGALAVSGRSNSDLKVYTLGTYGATGKCCIAALTIIKGKVENAVYSAIIDGAADAGRGIGIKVSPWSRDNLILTADGNALAEYTVDHSGNDLPLKKYAVINPSSPLLKYGAASFMRYGQKVYALLPSAKSGPDGLFAAIYDVTSGLSSAPQPLTSAFDVAEDSKAYIATSVCCLERGKSPVSVFVEGEGIVNCNFDAYVPEADPVDLQLELERLWIYSNGNGNHPGNIDGTDAQQGTAWNGRFYINNCNEKLVHVFDETGHLGTLPGGAGWGCARDDAGNIIVRDDKLSGDTHSFIIYPAGTTPEAPVEPTRLTVKFTLEGQANFINASGNVLSADGGHIYIFPSKQSQVTIARIVEGKEAGTYTSGELSFPSSAAGYVVPAGDNREEWYYQVRANGIKLYSGGANSDVVVGRAMTTAPTRNSTGGFAVIREGGNRVVLHGSGANYKGGFTVRDITMDKVIASVDPIGTLGYEEGGNYSTFNWLEVERKAYADYTVYQYCPANGIAVYRLYNKAVGVETVAVGRADIYARGAEVHAPGASGIVVYDLSGKNVGSVNADTFDTSALAGGVYIVRADNGAVLKLAK